ncbi:MAG: peptidoglycan-associated lipoprotein, partial [Gammaproteobacteria bacterium]
MTSKSFMMALVLVIFGIFLGGCQTIGDAGTSAEVQVEDLGSTVSETDTAGAEAHGIGDAEGFEGSALDDPDSPLSVRVIYFEYDSSEVSADYRPAIEAHAAYLAANPDVIVTLEG